MFATDMKPTIGRPFSITWDQNDLFMSAELQDCFIQNGIRHKVSTTYHAEIYGQIARMNEELTKMFAAHEVEGTGWLTAATNIQTIKVGNLWKTES